MVTLSGSALLRRLLFTLFLLSSFWMSPSFTRAEVISKYAPWYVDSNSPHVFMLSGEVDDGTALNFERAVSDFGPPNLLMLSSIGGLVNEALLVARHAHEMGTNTLVPAGAECYSACSLIFLSGKARVVDGKLGVHQISSENNDLRSGQLTIAVMLEILGKFDVPNELIVDMLGTPPDQIYIITDEDRLKFGFYLRSETERAAAGGESMEQRAAAFIINYNQVWSAENYVALDSISAFYPDSLQYFGKIRSKADVMGDKKAFALRWPKRSYSVDGSTISASCVGDTCHVSGNVTWNAESPERGKKSVGVALEQFVLSFNGDQLLITEEDGQVLKRY